MPDHKEHINYSAADIQRYVQGKMSAQEMHAIEKAALDDPFLADAIEGFQQGMQEHGEPLVNDQLQELRNQMHRTTTKSKTRVIAFRWWQAAAAAVIVIAGAVWIFKSADEPALQRTMTVAQKEKAVEHSLPAPAPVVTPDQAATATDSVSVSQPTTSEKPPASKQKPANAVTKKSFENDAVSENTPPSLALRETAVEQKDTSTLMANRASAASESLKKEEEKEGRIEALNKALAARQNQQAPTEPAPAAARKMDDYKNRETELITIGKNDSQAKQVVFNDKNLSGFVKGRVTDPFNNPVANAYVKMPNNNNYNILTDKTGYFKVPATDSVVDVSVNVVGYGTQNFRLQNNASLNQLQLQPANAALDEVQVTAKKSSAKRSRYQTSYPTVMLQDAEPVYGWVSYEQYLETNKKVPDDLPALKGNVAVSFVVNKKGELSDFKIEQSLTKSYDDEAIRLISQGPAWKLLKGRKARITVIVRF
jgi:hypothetical protein